MKQVAGLMKEAPEKYDTKKLRRIRDRMMFE